MRLCWFGILKFHQRTTTMPSRPLNLNKKMRAKQRRPAGGRGAAATATTTTTSGVVPLPRMTNPNLSPEAQAQEIRESDRAERRRRERILRAMERDVAEDRESSPVVGEKRKREESSGSEDAGSSVDLDFAVAKVRVRFFSFSNCF